MRDVEAGERALGCPDRGLLGGFSAAVLRHLRASPASEARSWGMAALTGYALKGPDDRAEVCARLGELIPEAPPPEVPGELSPHDSVDALPGIGPSTLTKLKSFGVSTVGDLLEHLPRDYIDRRRLASIRELRVGQQVTVVATVRKSKVDRTRAGRRLLRVTVGDGTGYIECLWWNQEWRARQLPEGTQAAVSGVIEHRAGRLQITNPAYDILSDEQRAVNTGQIVPIYPASESVSADLLRKLIRAAVDRLAPIPDPLPAAMRARRGLMPRDVALRTMHFPRTPEELPEARRRLVFDELFGLQVALALRKRHMETELRGIAHIPKGDDLPSDRFLSTLAFRPTFAQTRAMREIAADMAKPRPMHRLLQGEVGSGKTLVAVQAALVAVSCGSQAVIMAPTEVLAGQHARKIREMLEPLGIDVALITSSVNKSVRADATMRLASGDIQIACGTHALLSEDVQFRRLGLIIVDEQHRFGLGQRVQLRSKGDGPDVLIMTATPIPRTLALTLYGDLDVSVLDELPSGRQPILTRVLDGSSESDRMEAYELIRTEVAQGRRAFVVCALVDDSDTLQAKAAIAEAERLGSDVFPDLKVGLLHGQMRPADKDRIMNEFRCGEISVLISTTVIEVGVDVPEATVMMIENAERFGLSQLHQLRGRVGRGAWGGHCLLVSEAKTPDSRRRLEAVANTTDGFELAEEDLKIRGEGTIFGNRQAGMVDLKIARLVEDFPVVVEAREAAFAIVDADPTLKAPEMRIVRSDIQSRFGDSIEWLFKG